VLRGKWKGVEVAVKRFIKQKLDERRMLEFRAEMAFLSELHHPNIVLFIGTHRTLHTAHAAHAAHAAPATHIAHANGGGGSGACVKKPNLCIVTEFMAQGSLRDTLGNSAIKLTWKQKVKMLRAAALGINYLHSLQPVIVHRDLKPSNLLVRTTFVHHHPPPPTTHHIMHALIL
jgi:serine/threonine protein kinase